ncbi:MAG: glycosyltransferase family 39 protein [Anaerolineales bacterium]|nr:glycosyltransferase family 39 protein [Anaerolineales bacterium]
MKQISKHDLLWALPVSLALGAWLASVQPGNWFVGWLGFSFLFLLTFLLLSSSVLWAGGGRHLVWMVALAFLLRFAGGVGAYLSLPVYGYDDVDDQSGFVYTDARRRDTQAWELADSNRPIMAAFNQKFAYDQYGGLLAFSALVYRYLSPDAHRVLMLVLLSALMGALGVPFLWKSIHLLWGEKKAFASAWIFALYPESLLLGGSAMREPYLLAFSAFALWGFASWHSDKDRSQLLWLGLGLAGMLLVSPAIALATLVILGGWMFFAREQSRISWQFVVLLAVVFIAGLFLLSSALDRGGNLGGGGPLGVVQNFIRESLKWNVYKVEAESGWVQKLFDEMPQWLRLPFVMVYGVLQPVLPAIFIAPTTVVWRIIGILRSVGWYAILPALILAPFAGTGAGGEKKRAERSRSILLWLSFIVWGWALFTALRGGGDQWDNPRYRTILFMWQAVLAGHVWVWWRETKNAWVVRVIAMEVVFVVVFGQWYANRYLHIGFQLPFPVMVAVILGLWVLIVGWGVWRDRLRRARVGV